MRGCVARAYLAVGRQCHGGVETGASGRSQQPACCSCVHHRPAGTISRCPGAPLVPACSGELNNKAQQRSEGATAPVACLRPHRSSADPSLSATSTCTHARAVSVPARPHERLVDARRSTHLVRHVLLVQRVREHFVEDRSAPRHGAGRRHRGQLPYTVRAVGEFDSQPSPGEEEACALLRPLAEWPICPFSRASACVLEYYILELAGQARSPASLQ
jgi:hypothetical protein